MCLKAGTGRGVGIAVNVTVGIGTVAVRVGNGVNVGGTAVSVVVDGVIVDSDGIEVSGVEQPTRQNATRNITQRLMSVPSIQIAPEVGQKQPAGYLHCQNGCRLAARPVTAAMCVTQPG